MARIKASGYANPHQANEGNGCVAIMQHTFTAADAQNDEIRLGDFSNNTYHRLEVVTDAATGVTLDLGIVQVEAGTEDLDYFGAGLAAAGARVSVDKEPLTVDGLHEIVATAKGADPTAGTTFTIIAHYIHNR